MMRLLKNLLPKAYCGEFETDLVLYAYGKIADRERAGIEAHLDTCPACRARQDQLLEELATAPLDFPPPQFWDDYSRGMRQKLEAVDEQRHRKLRWLSPLSYGGITALAAGLVLVIALGLTLKDTLFSSADETQEDAMMQVLPIVQNLEFFESMHYLEMMNQEQEESIKSSDVRDDFGGTVAGTTSLARTSGCEKDECSPSKPATRLASRGLLLSPAEWASNSGSGKQEVSLEVFGQNIA